MSIGLNDFGILAGEFQIVGVGVTYILGVFS